jgi:hypothetical protein
MRWLAFIVYGSLLLVGTWLILHRTDAQRLAFTATRSLPANHLLRENDIAPASWYRPELFPDGPRPADFAGRYLKGALLPGEAIRRDETSAVPLLDVDAPSWMLVVPVAQELVQKQEIRPGQAASVCLRPASDRAASRRPERNKLPDANAKPRRSQVQGTIVALLCSAAAPTPCTVLLKFSAVAARRAVSESSGKYTVAALATSDQSCR